MKWKSESCGGSLGNARKYYLNEHFFDAIDTEEKSYWLGFISADGCVRFHDNSGILSIILKLDDYQHLYKFTKALNSNYVVRIHKNTCHLVINSKILINSLIKLGITPKKSFTLHSCQKIPNELLKHYYRGLVDGDGCLHKRQDGFFEIGLVGTYDICESFRTWLFSQGVKFRAKTVPIRSFYGFRVNGNGLPKYVCKLLYLNSNVYLDRKYKLAMEIIND